MQSVVNFKCHQTDNGDGQPITSSVLAREWVLQVRAKRKYKIWSSLRCKEVVNIEELDNAGERGFPMGIAGLPPEVCYVA